MTDDSARTVEYWRQRAERVVQRRLQGTTLSAFNPNVDVLLHLNPQALANLLERNPQIDGQRVQAASHTPPPAIHTHEDFLGVLLDRLREGKSLLIVSENLQLFDWLAAHFPARSSTLGGQAGIMANQLSKLEARSVLYSPIFSRAQAEVMDPRVLFPRVGEDRLEIQPCQSAAREGDPTRSPWIFEYAAGETFDFGFTQVTTPRANRLIVVSRIPGLGMNFREDFVPWLPELGRTVDTAFVAGYHLGGPEPGSPDVTRQYFAESAVALQKLRAHHADLPVHLEYVPMKEAAREREMLETILPHVDSFGINEAEIRHVLQLFGFSNEADSILESETAATLFAGGLALLRRFELNRIHIHNLGYHVLLLRRPYPRSLEAVRDAALFGSCVNACRALYGREAARDEVIAAASLPVSRVGLEQLLLLGPDGVVEGEDYVGAVVPTQVVDQPRITVGMGDTISAASYAMETIGS